MPLISIIIPAFNAELYLEEAIHSALAQSFADLEIIVVNDGSSDRTGKILEDMARRHERIIAIDNGRNEGAAFSRNVGIGAASGDWIALLDADDWWDQRRLAVLLEMAERHCADIVADNLYFVEDRTMTPWRTLFPRKRFSKMPISVDDYLQNDMPGVYGTWGVLKPMFRKSFLSKNNILYNENMRTKQDNAFYLECFIHKPIFLLCSDPLYYYRIHTHSISSAVRIPDLMKSQEINRHYLRKFRLRGANSTCALLSLRLSRFDKYIRYRKVIEPIKRGDWTGAIKQAAGDISIAAYGANMFLQLVIRSVRMRIARLRPHRNADPSPDPAGLR